MLRTNLSTRPFYNDRVIRVGIAAGVLFVAALTAFNVLQILSLNQRTGELTARAEAAEAATAQLRENTRLASQAIDQKEVVAVQAAAREANRLIEQRVFSWTDLFNRFEETLPADVRIVAVQPQVDNDGRMLVAVTTLARRAEDLHAFLDQLEATGVFSEVIPRQDEITDEGLLSATVQGYYGPSAAPATVPASPASDNNASAATPSSANASPRGVR